MRSRARIEDLGTAFLFCGPCWLGMRADGRKKQIIRRFRRRTQIFEFKSADLFDCGCRRRWRKVNEEKTNVQSRMTPGVFRAAPQRPLFFQGAHLVRRCAPFRKVRTLENADDFFEDAHLFSKVRTCT
jgi:hypothetical protein